MLGNVVAQKRGRRRRSTQTKPGTLNVSAKKEENHRITEYFPVRRSNRKTSKQIECEESAAIESAILSGSHESLIEVFTSVEKGRGCRALRRFRRGEFVIEYRGEMLDDYAVAKKREELYAEDPSIGSYMYFFKYKNRPFCVDATAETPFKGRLINHSILRPNLKTKVVEMRDGSHRLVLIARRDIDEGEELLYDYGDRTPATVAHNPWLLDS